VTVKIEDHKKRVPEVKDSRVLGRTNKATDPLHDVITGILDPLDP
jgi:hypothetical protein